MEQEGGKAGSFEDGSAEIIGACIEVHRHLGPGLLESTYEGCLCHELSLAPSPVREAARAAARLQGVELECGYRLDVVVGDALLIAILVNFNVAVLRHGLRRLSDIPTIPSRLPAFMFILSCMCRSDAPP